MNVLSIFLKGQYNLYSIHGDKSSGTITYVIRERWIGVKKTQIYLMVTAQPYPTMNSTFGRHKNKRKVKSTVLRFFLDLRLNTLHVYFSFHEDGRNFTGHC